MGWGGPRGSQGYTWVIQEGCLEVGPLRVGLGGKRMCQARKGILVRGHSTNYN